jgi:hypothetical protein
MQHTHATHARIYYILCKFGLLKVSSFFRALGLVRSIKAIAHRRV